MNDLTSQNHTAPYTKAEELWNSITHGLGVLLSITGLIILLAISWDAPKINMITYSIYGGSLILLYLASTLYHSFNTPKLKRIMKIADHSCIYLLIAGSYTPFLLLELRDKWDWSVGLLIAVWTIAGCGIVFKLFFAGRFRAVSTLIYLGMGWLSVVAFKALFTHLSVSAFVWLVAGGLLYTIGAYFYVNKKIPFNHAIWHLFVLAGSFGHYMAVYDSYFQRMG